MIDWNDNTKRRAFREALQNVYSSILELKMFIDEELREELSKALIPVVGEANLQSAAYNLVAQAKAACGLDEVYAAFKSQNPSHPVLNRLEQQPLASPTYNLSQNDWETLFQLFLLDDVADLKRAFERGFKKALGLTFQQAQPKHLPLIELTQIRELLGIYDTNDKKPALAVHFVECAITELQRSSSMQGNNRDLTALGRWCDRIKKEYSMFIQNKVSDKTVACNAYLLVVLDVIGSDVNVYPELHISGMGKATGFGAQPTTCPVDRVAIQISEWILQAEDILDIDTCDDEQVTLEIFLPCQYLEEDIATTWKVRDKRGDEVSLGNYRRFLVRSSERIRDRQIQKALELRWAELELCVKAENVYDKFHLQEECPQHKGSLCAVLKDMDALGLKFVAQLPIDSNKRTDLLNDIIDAALPVALWSSEIAEIDADILKAEFDNLLRQSNLTNFTDLAKQWRKQRMMSIPAKHIRLLCDRPDRVPKLPNPDQEEDLLVAF